MSRRTAIRTGTAVGAAGAALAAGGLVDAARAGAAGSAWRRVTVEVDQAGDPNRPAVTTLRADSGTPQRGDFFHTSGLLLAPGQTEGPEIGEWQCRAVWTSSQGDMSARHNLYCTFFYELFGRGAIAGITNRGGAEPLSHIGAVVGGTGEFFGASGSWQQEPVRAGVTRQVFDLILPEV